MNIRRLRSNRWLLALVLIVGAGALVLACSTDSPSEPSPGGQSPGDGGGAAGQFNITVTADPPTLTLPPAGSTEDPPTSTITIQVRRTDGSVPANGTTVAVSATNGVLGTDGQASGFVELFNGRATITFTPTADGIGVVRAQLGNSVGQATIQILRPDEFAVTGLEPRTGSPSGGQVVTIFGQGFVSPVRVTFDGVPATVQSVSSGRITVLVPPTSDPLPSGETLTVDVTVTIGVGSLNLTDTLPSAFTYTHGGSTARPTILSVTPASGPNEGGTLVRILGSGFRAPVQVVFGAEAQCGAVAPGVEASVQSVTNTEIVAVAPAATSFGQDNRNQSVNVVVTNLDSGFCGQAVDAYRYGAQILITAISPNEGPSEGGQLVTIFGQGFDEPVAVSLAGVAAQIVSVTGTEIVVRSVGVEPSGCSDVVGPTVVTNIESGDTATGPQYRYDVPSPLISTISPNRGDEDGGTTVTISGSGFDPPVRVTFGDQAATGVSVNSAGTAVTATTPQFTGAFRTEACDDNADGTQGERFLPTSVDVTVINLESTCEDTFPNGFIYEPDDTSCRNDVAPPPEEDPECSDGFDNDGDGFTDAEDPECTGPDDDDESA